MHSIRCLSTPLAAAVRHAGCPSRLLIRACLSLHERHQARRQAAWHPLAARSGEPCVGEEGLVGLGPSAAHLLGSEGLQQLQPAASMGRRTARHNVT